MADLVTLQGWLADAETARHKLVTGSLRASVAYNGQQVTFSKTQLSDLDAYIASLKAQIAGVTGDPRNVVRPIHLTF